MDKFGIPRLGPAHLRKGKCADWNKGRKHSSEAKAKNSFAHFGRVPHNINVGRIAFDCCVCGKEVLDKPYRKKHTCSAQCKNIYLARLNGPDHWNYKGEKAGNRQRQRNWAVYKEWRLLVLAQDNYTCKKCAVMGGRLTAHHLNSFAAHEQERYDLSNGVTLCWRCHWDFHRKYGHRLTTTAQFHEWVTMK